MFYPLLCYKPPPNLTSQNNHLLSSSFLWVDGAQLGSSSGLSWFLSRICSWMVAAARVLEAQLGWNLQNDIFTPMSGVLVLFPGASLSAWHLILCCLSLQQGAVGVFTYWLPGTQKCELPGLLKA